MSSSMFRCTLLSATLALLSGCTLLYANDADQKQCDTNEDCKSSGATFECKAHVCVSLSSASTDAGTNDAATADASTPRVACKDSKNCGKGERCGFDGFCYEKWGCLNNDPDWLENVEESFTYESEIRSLQSPDELGLLGKITAIACSAADPECQRPKVPASASKVSSDKVLKVPFTNVGTSGFVGVIRIIADLPTEMPVEGASEPKPVLPGYFHYTGENPLVGNMVAQNRALLIDEGTYGLLGGLAGLKADSTAGTIVFLIYDCGGRSAADISITPSGVEDFTFVPIQSETTPVINGTSTTEDGVAILVNIPPGSQVFSIKDEKLGRVSDQFSFNVRGNAINYVQYYPRYSGMKAWLDEHARREKAER